MNKLMQMQNLPEPASNRCFDNTSGSLQGVGWQRRQKYHCIPQIWSCRSAIGIYLMLTAVEGGKDREETLIGQLWLGSWVVEGFCYAVFFVFCYAG